MPIPFSPIGESREPRPLQLVPNVGNSPEPAAPFYPRALAHFVDYCVVHGTSLYSAKFFSVLLLSFHARAFDRTDRFAGAIFREAFESSSAQLLAASFASIALLYFVALPLVTGRTLGLGLLGLRIRDASGGMPSWRQLAYRLLGCLVGYATFGAVCLIGLRHRDGKFLQDSWSETSITRS
jgi:hypothetical protein